MFTKRLANTLIENVLCIVSHSHLVAAQRQSAQCVETSSGEDGPEWWQANGMTKGLK